MTQFGLGAKIIMIMTLKFKSKLCTLVSGACLFKNASRYSLLDHWDI